MLTAIVNKVFFFHKPIIIATKPPTKYGLENVGSNSPLGINIAGTQIAVNTQGALNFRARSNFGGNEIALARA